MDSALWHRNESKEAWDRIKEHLRRRVLTSAAVPARVRGVTGDDFVRRERRFEHAMENLSEDVEIGVQRVDLPQARIFDAMGGYEWCYKLAESPDGFSRPTGKPGEPLHRLRTQGGMKRDFHGTTVWSHGREWDVRRQGELEALAASYILQGIVYEKRDERRKEEKVLQLDDPADQAGPAVSLEADWALVRLSPGMLRDTATQAERRLRLAAAGATFAGADVAPRFHVLTRLFVLYFYQACLGGPEFPPLDDGFPSFSRWLAAEAGVPLPHETSLSMLDAWASLLDRPVTGGIPDDRRLADLVFRLETHSWDLQQGPSSPQRNRPLQEAGDRRERLAQWVGRGLTPDPGARLDGEAMRVAGERRLQELGQELEEARLAALAQALTRDHWKRLVNYPTLERVAGGDQPDSDRWFYTVNRPVVDRGPMGKIVSGELPHYLWWQACLSMLARGPAGRAALDRAKSRAEEVEKKDEKKIRAAEKSRLDDFYVLIGCMPGGRENSGKRKALCERVRELYREFLEGDIGPDDARECRAHLEECGTCYYAFADYVRDREAWGYRPEPAVALLREKLRAGATPLLQVLGAIAGDMARLGELVREHRTRYGTRGFAFTAGTPDEAGFAGFGLAPGDPVEVRTLGCDGAEGPVLKGVVAAMSVDAQSRSASVTLRLEEVPAGVCVLAARAEAGEVPYSLAGEIQDGEATLSAACVPEECDPFRVDRWYAVRMEDEGVGP